MYRGRTSFPVGGVFGHEQTGRVVEVGPEVRRVSVGDWVSIPFNVSCGQCDNCKERKTNLCLDVNDLNIGGAYGFADVSALARHTETAAAGVPYATSLTPACNTCDRFRLHALCLSADGRSDKDKVTWC